MKSFMNNEILDSTQQVFKKRLFSPIYGTFVITWVIVHWDFFVTLFFVSEDGIIEKTGLLKNEYLRGIFFDSSNFWSYVYFILPFILTYIIIWHFPKWVATPAFKEYLRTKTEQEKLTIEAQKQLELQKVEKLEIVTSRVKKEHEVKKTEKEITAIDPTADWQKEYEEFRNDQLFSQFQWVVDAIYKNNGQVRVYDSYHERYTFEVPQQVLVYAHTNDLITLDKERGIIEITEKGKYFIKQFSNQKK